MVITSLGEGTFRLQSGETSLLIDPSGNRLKADVVLRTASPVREAPGEEGVFACAGEYELKGIEIEGFEAKEESTPEMVKTAYLVRFEDISVAVLGTVSKTPDMNILDHVGETDVLILPVHEDHFLPPEEAAKLAKQLSPSIVIPAHADKKNLAEFAKALGQKADAEDRFTFKKKDLQPETVILKVLGT